MKLAVFGGTGNVGLHLVRQALDAGHEVTVLVRTPSKMTVHHPNLTCIEGDAMNAADVDKTVKDNDAVLVTLGHNKTTPRDMQTVATRHIIGAMHKHGIKRLITLTGGGVRHPDDQPKVVDYIFGFLLKVINGDVLRDAVNHVDLIKSSDLEWVVVRAPMIVEGDRTRQYNVGMVGTTEGIRITRGDVADFMLKRVNETAHLGKMPMLGSKSASVYQ